MTIAAQRLGWKTTPDGNTPPYSCIVPSVGDAMSNQICATGSLCDPATNTCVRIPVIGDPCLVGANGGMPQRVGGLCNMTLAPPRCVAKLPPDSNCSADDNSCMDGLRCMCADGTGACAQTVCVQY